MTENRQPTDLTGHVAIVTGANHGIGAATAVALAARGASVLVTYLRLNKAADPGTQETYRRNQAKDAAAVLEAIAAVSNRSGNDVGAGYAVEADLSDPLTPARLFDVAEREYGPVDILVNNATGWLADTFKSGSRDRFNRPLTQITADTFDHVFAVDARGGALMIAEFARRHAAQGGAWGRIVSLTSGGALGFPEEISYGAAKAALNDYTLSAAVELAPLGITANVVHPPVTDTGWVTHEVRDAVASEDWLMHVAAPEEVAEVIAYLCEDRARLVNGNVLTLR